jgi:hypothetical protein
VLRPISSLLLCALLGGAVVASPARALAPEDEEFEPIESVEPVDPHARTRVADSHDPNRAAHPLRIAAYALHPVGVTLDWVIVRPAVWVAKREPFRTIFGYQD